jgi:hypothetical protein
MLAASSREHIAGRAGLGAARRSAQYSDVSGRQAYCNDSLMSRPEPACSGRAFIG